MADATKASDLFASVPKLTSPVKIMVETATTISLAFPLFKKYKIITGTKIKIDARKCKSRSPAACHLSFDPTRMKSVLPSSGRKTFF
jgi:hypothetical protein